MKSLSNRPRIGIDFHTFDGIFQGSRSHILGLYKEAISLAPDLQFVFFLDNTAALRAEDPAFSAANVELVSMPHSGGLKRLGWQLARLRRQYTIDLLHVQYRLPFLAAGPCACTIHDVLFETHPQFFTPSFVRMSKFTGRLAARNAALIFTVSDYSRSEIARLYELNESRIEVTTNGVDNARFYPGTDGIEHIHAQNLVSGEYLCTVGRLEPRKNHINLLRAYALLEAPRPPLVVVGQRDEGSEPIFEELRKLKLENEVVFLQNISDQGIPALIRHARIFVYPSFAEGFGMPIAEAMASGVPVVTSNLTALPEVAGDAALTADPDRPEDIARAIQSLLDDSAACAGLRTLGVAQAAKFNWKIAASTLVDSYRRYFSS